MHRKPENLNGIKYYQLSNYEIDKTPITCVMLFVHLSLSGAYLQYIACLKWSNYPGHSVGYSCMNDAASK